MADILVTDDIFLYENSCIFIHMPLKFVPKGPIDNKPTLVLIVRGAELAASHYLNQLWSGLVYWHWKYI